MQVSHDDRIRFASLLARSYSVKNLVPTKELIDRTLIHFEWDPDTGIWSAIPSGLAIIAEYDDAEAAIVPFCKAFAIARWSYEKAGEIITGVPGELMTQANRVFGRGQLSLEEIIAALNNNEPLEAESLGPIIIDKMSDPGA